MDNISQMLLIKTIISDIKQEKGARLRCLSVASTVIFAQSQDTYCSNEALAWNDSVRTAWKYESTWTCVVRKPNIEGTERTKGSMSNINRDVGYWDKQM